MSESTDDEAWASLHAFISYELLESRVTGSGWEVRHYCNPGVTWTKVCFTRPEWGEAVRAGAREFDDGTYRYRSPFEEFERVVGHAPARLTINGGRLNFEGDAEYVDPDAPRRDLELSPRDPHSRAPWDW